MLNNIGDLHTCLQLNVKNVSKPLLIAAERPERESQIDAHFPGSSIEKAGQVATGPLPEPNAQSLDLHNSKVNANRNCYSY